MGVAEVVDVVVLDGLEGRAEFAAPVFAGGKIIIGKKRLHLPCFRAELHVGDDFFAKLKGELNNGHELGGDIGSVGAIRALEY